MNRRELRRLKALSSKKRRPRTIWAELREQEQEHKESSFRRVLDRMVAKLPAPKAG